MLTITIHYQMINLRPSLFEDMRVCFKVNGDHGAMRKYVVNQIIEEIAENVLMCLLPTVKRNVQ